MADKDDIISRLVAKQAQRDADAEAHAAEEHRKRKAAEKLTATAKKDWDGARTRIQSEVSATNNLLKAAKAELKFRPLEKELTGDLIAAYQLRPTNLSHGLDWNIAATFEVRIDGETTVWISDGGEQALGKLQFTTSELQKSQIDEIVTALLKKAERN